MQQADAAHSNYSRIVEKLMNSEGEYARARLLQAAHFLIHAGSKNKKYYLNDSIGQAARGLLYFEKTFGPFPFNHSKITERERKIYADLLFWKAMAYADWIQDQGGGYKNEWSRIVKEMQLVIEKGFGCLNDGGAYRILKQFAQAYQCTMVKQANNDEFNWNGWNVLLWAQNLYASGDKEQAIRILRKFISTPAAKLSFDFIPENTKSQKQGAEILKSWGEIASAEFVPGEYLVQFKNPFVLARHRSLNGTVTEKISDEILLVRRPLIETAQYSLQALNAIPGAKIVEPNYIYRASSSPNDPYFSQLWGLKNYGQADAHGRKGLSGIDISIERAWSLTTGNHEMTVAIIDTGVDFSVPDLSQTAWTNQAELNGRTGVDDDDNGYIDDIHGYDFINNKGEVIDDHGHGTHIAGILGAQGNDGVGIVGIQWNVKIMSLKFLAANGGGDLAAAIKAIRYAIKMGAKITNNSWGGGEYSEILKSVIQEASEAGVLFVAAAGNSAQNADVLPEYPAAYNLENIISVAAVNNRGRLSDFSNFGAKSVHIAAPGENILSTIPGGYASWSGTSMAAPYVTGVAALVWGHDTQQGMREVRDRILKFSQPMADLRNKVSSASMVNAYLALTGKAAPEDPYDPELWKISPSSVSSSHPYHHNERKEFEFKIEGARFLTIHFSKFQIEPNYDRMIFFDRNDYFFGMWSGQHNNEYAPIVEGDTLRVHFFSDDIISEYGFDIDKILHQ